MSDEELPGTDSLRDTLEVRASAVPPDFADVLARMRARDPGSESLFEIWEEDDEAFVEPATELASAADEAMLSDATEALRARIESSLERFDLQPLPVPRLDGDAGADEPQPGPSKVSRLDGRRRRRGLAWAAGIALCLSSAAALALWVAPRLASEDAAMQRSSQALDGVVERGMERSRAVQREAEREREGVEEPSPAPTPAPEPELEPEPAPPTDIEEASETGESEAPTKAKPKRSLAERLDALDAKAQAKWREGDLAGAQATYRKLVSIGGRHPKVELAFAELFALGRQRGEDLSKLWTLYLRRFPNGRYARDAKAGLCRKASGAEREACWAEYADRFPGAKGGP